MASCLSKKASSLASLVLSKCDASCRLFVKVDTVDESENETAGRGMIANREIKEGDELFTLPVDLLLTKDAARKVHAGSV